jgi:hypothetical protein
VQDPFFRQDLFNKGNFFHSVPVENSEADHYICILCMSSPPYPQCRIGSAMFTTFANRDERQSRKTFLMLMVFRNAIN